MPSFPSLARAEKNSSALQGSWLEEPEGFPTHVSFRKGNKTAIMAAARETKGSLRPRKANRRGVTTPHGEQKGRYTPVEVSPLRPFGARPPARRGSSFLPALTATFRSL